MHSTVEERQRTSWFCAMTIAAVAAITCILPSLAQGQNLDTFKERPTGWSEIVAQDSAAVVMVTPSQRSLSSGDGPMADTHDMSEMMRRFLERERRSEPFPQQFPPFPRFQTQTNGSGFVIDVDGLIVTSDALIGSAEGIAVTLEDGTVLPARVAGQDALTGIAVLRVESEEPLTSLEWGSSQSLRIGDEVLAIGRSDAFGVTAWLGQLAGRDPTRDLLLIDDSLHRSALGGPIVDQEGMVVGIVTEDVQAGSTDARFAVASQEAQRIITALVQAGTVARGHLGVRIQSVTAEIVKALNLERASGALVTGVQPDSPAERAGLQPGDIIIGLDGGVVESPEALSKRVADLKPGTKARLQVWREGSETELEATLSAAPNKSAAATVEREETGSTQIKQLGLGVAELTPELRVELGLPEDAEGVVIMSIDSAETEATGLQTGDLILGAPQHTVRSIDDLRQIVDRAAEDERGLVLLLVAHGGDRSFVPVPFVRI